MHMWTLVNTMAPESRTAVMHAVCLHTLACTDHFFGVKAFRSRNCEMLPCLHNGMGCRFRGGVEAEREERKHIRDEEEATKRANFEAMQAIRREGWRKVCCLG